MSTAQPTSDLGREIVAGVFDLEKDEPPILDVICHNDLMRAMGTEREVEPGHDASEMVRAVLRLQGAPASVLAASRQNSSPLF